MTALFHTGAVIVVAGTGYVIATQANKHRSKNKKNIIIFKLLSKKAEYMLEKD